VIPTAVFRVNARSRANKWLWLWLCGERPRDLDRVGGGMDHRQAGNCRGNDIIQGEIRQAEWDPERNQVERLAGLERQRAHRQRTAGLIDPGCGSNAHRRGIGGIQLRCELQG